MTSRDSATSVDRRCSALWAKTDRDNPSPDRYHALVLHLIDVAAVANELQRTAWSPYRRRRWADALGVDDDVAGKWLAFIAGAHDLGKASPSFQQRAEGHLDRINRQTGQSFKERQLTNPLPHGFVTVGTLAGLLVDRFEVAPLPADRFAMATGAHHGAFASSGEFMDALPESGRQREIGTGVWATWRADLLDYLATAVGLPQPLPIELRDCLLTYPSALTLAGTVSYSDWVGSDERFFPLTTIVPEAPAEAFDESTTKARSALRELRFHVPSVAIPAGSISETFDLVREPNDGQIAAMEAMETANGPGIAVIEYPMGWGKTEVALWMAARWAERDGVEGFYVAMPTRTTSDQLFQRVNSMIQFHAGATGANPNLIKVSGQTPYGASEPDIGQITAEEDIFSNANPSADRDTGTGAERASQVDARQQRNESFRRARWFGQRGRGPLATYGVGTIDQAMLGVLTTRHHFVRLAGLDGRTIIFDEVHSYDVYMSTIVDRLLGFLGALGCPVVILTATLPMDRTRSLVKAYTDGAEWNLTNWLPAEYPRFTVATANNGAVSVPVPVPENGGTGFQLERIPHDPADEVGLWTLIAGRLHSALAAGGTAAVICNTVAQAQAAYRALASVFPVDELELFHARFRQRERRAIQERVLRHFGKDTGTKDHPIRPHRRVVIATQVIEQSLDLDFDLMVSMFCPVDLLLQRSGRLQRHRKTEPFRPSSLRQPVLWLTGYDETAGVPRFPRGSDAVYGTYPLLRSWWALRELEIVHVPGDVTSLIETAYAGSDDPPSDAPELAAMWAKANTAYRKRQAESERKAEGGLIPALSEDDLSEGVGNDALTPELRTSEPEAAQTRLGPPSITVVVLKAGEAQTHAKAVAMHGREKPSMKQIGALLDRSVPVSLRGITQELQALPRPPSWERVSSLRHTALVVLDEGGQMRMPGESKWTIRLDPRLGLCLDRTDAAQPLTIDQEEE